MREPFQTPKDFTDPQALESAAVLKILYPAELLHPILLDYIIVCETVSCATDNLVINDVSGTELRGSLPNGKLNGVINQRFSNILSLKS